VDALLKTLQGFGIGRVAAYIGAAAGAVAILMAVLLRAGAEPKSLLYANLDLKEASQITAALDSAGVKYELKGDGSTIFVSRDKVASSRLLLSGKGLPTSGSVGYEIFDSAPAMGQTDFVQTLNRQRALEGELARTIRSIQGINFVRVHLVLPKKQLFDDDNEQPSASILVATNAGRLGAMQVRSIRNLVAGAVPDLKPERVSMTDQQGELLAAEGSDAAGDDAGGSARTQAEERIRRTVKDLVEGVVGVGKARVQVSADLDLARVTTQSEKYDPDGQVVRSTQTTDEKSNEMKPASTGQVSASQNIPNGQPGGSPTNDSSNSGKQEETTNYEISKTTRTEVEEPGRVKRLSVAVAVDGVQGPPVHGKPGPYRARTPQEMAQIEQLVHSAMGFDTTRGDQATVVNVKFDQSTADEGVSAASPFNFDKNDLMRAAELGVLLVVAGLIIFFVAKPMVSGLGGNPALGGLGRPQLAMAGGGGGGVGGVAGGGLALEGPDGVMLNEGIDIARIEGQVRASSVKKVADFVDKHPDESVSILRAWLHEGG
jgi:flagellar M-ring protein FliF